ncbi:hypothetical protein [Halobacillus litoralis]|uniref:hypothetical protein n=1 Tax=Halobacillus litoralis TaxID=45668 RepID=UPI001CFD460C|nr:hypothetical protein [Halobacillus litoralis]
MTIIGDVLISLFFLIGGLLFLYFILAKYTEEAHQKEVKKNNWMKKDKTNYENPLFFKLMSHSYMLTKSILIICAGIFTLVGIFLLFLKLYKQFIYDSHLREFFF